MDEEKKRLGRMANCASAALGSMMGAGLVVGGAAATAPVASSGEATEALHIALLELEAFDADQGGSR